SNISLAVENADFLRESTAELEGLLPSVVSLALPQLTGVIPDIALPDILGFRLDSLALSKVTSGGNDFLAVSATLGPSPTLARLAERLPGLDSTTARLASAVQARAVARGGARLVRVTTPAPEAIRAHLRGEGGAMPEVVIDVAARDALGRDLEWTWNLG